MQNDFITGALGTKEAQAIVPSVVGRINEYAKEPRECFIIGTLDTHGEDYADTLEGKLLPVPHCIRGTDGWALHPDVEAAVNKDIFEEKPTFGSYALAAKLAMLDELDTIESIEFVGLCTDICVISNALLFRAAFPNTPITVRASCCAGTTPEKHEAALKVMESCQIEVIR